MEINLVFPGEPKAVQSFRFARAGNFMRKYQPQDTVNWKTFIKVEALRQLPGGFLCSERPCVVSCRFLFRLPGSARKSERDMVQQGLPVFKATRPDLTDNLFKGMIDALTGVLWHDDAQIVGVTDSYKLYSDNPRTELTVRFED
jgi:Holliday junction resolvase RusA-like endonuclease